MLCDDRRDLAVHVSMGGRVFFGCENHPKVNKEICANILNLKRCTKYDRCRF